MKAFLLSFLRVAVTLALAAAAAVAGLGLWRHYMDAPWTRDGRVRAEVVAIAPEVAGTVVRVAVHDNQFVHKGDLLFQIDPSRYRLAVAEAQATVEQRRQDLLLKQADARRRAGMAGVVSAEDIDRHRSTSAVAAAALQSAEAALDLARLNLDRTSLVSPVNGYVTNARLRVGDYAQTGAARLSVIDADSFWVTGYFEETRLARVHVNDPARMRLMGYKTPLEGHVDSIGRGISDSNGRADPQGLPDVNPVFTWVRLAQRIPVRLHIDRVPPGVLLAAGMTCTVAVGPERDLGGSYAARLRGLLRDALDGESL